MTPEQLRDEYGELMWEAIQAFTTDFGYLASMIDHANSIEYRAALSKASWEVPRSLPQQERRRQTYELLRARGVHIPENSRLLKS